MQGLLSSAHTGSDSLQLPAMHSDEAVHASPSSQAMPSFSGTDTHSPVPSQPSTVQGLLSSVHVNSTPLHSPTMHRSAVVHGSPSSHGTAPETGCFAEHIIREVQYGAFDYLDAPIELVAAVDVPPPMSPPLEAEFIPSPEKLTGKVLAMLGKA